MAKYFKENEIIRLNATLVSMLDTARSLAEIPFIITSGFRTPEQNSQAGGVSDSAHLKGLAVDLRCKTDNDRYLIVKSLLKAGFKRIEIAPRHIHTDIDTVKSQEIIWLGTDN